MTSASSTPQSATFAEVMSSAHLISSSAGLMSMRLLSAMSLLSVASVPSSVLRTPQASMLPVPCISSARDVGKRAFAVAASLFTASASPTATAILCSDRGDGNHKMAVTHFAASHDFVTRVQLSSRNHVVKRVDQNA